MKKALGQTVRDLKREVNKKVLKVPGIEQKILDATSNEPWGPHGSHLADLAQASRNSYDYQMIMNVIWKRINDTGKNWRHVYKALTVLEYLVAHGSERVIDEIREHAHQISTLSNFQYIDSGGRDQGSNVRRKSQSLVALVNDKERVQEVRQKANVNKDKYQTTSSTGGAYRPSSYSGTGGYGDDDRSKDHYGYRDDDRNGHGRERDYGYRDDDRYGRGGDSYNRDGDRYGRDHEERYGRDGYKDDDYRGRGTDDYQLGSRRSVDRYTDRSIEDDDRHSSRSGGGRADDHSHDDRRLEQQLSDQNIGAPPSYEEATRDAGNHIQNERDGEDVASPTRRSSSPAAPKATSPTKSTSQGPDRVMSAESPAAPNKQVDAFDFFDPRGSVSAAPPAASNPELDFFGSLSASDSTNSLALMPATSATTISESDMPTNSGFGANFASPSTASTVLSQTNSNPFGDPPFMAAPQENFQAQSQNFAHVSSIQPSSGSVGSAEPFPPVAPKVETVPTFDFGDMLGGLSYTPVENGQHYFATTTFSTPEIPVALASSDVLDGILPQTGSAAIASSQTAQPAALINTQTAQMSVLPESGLSTMFPSQAATISSQAALSAAPNNMQLAHLNLLQQQGVSALASLPSQAAPVSSQAAQLAVPNNMEPAHLNCLQQPGIYTSGSLPSLAASGSLHAPQPAAPGNIQSVQLNPLQPPEVSTLLASQAAPTTSFGPPAKTQPSKFAPRSTVWADTLSRGLVDLNISGPKTNPLSDIGIDFDSINRMEKRKEAKSSAAPVSSTITMGKAMGSGSGIGRAGAGGLAPPPNPMVGTGMGMGGGAGIGMGAGMGMGMGGGGGMGMGVGMGMGMGGYGGGMNQLPMGVGMGIGMNMGMGQGAPMQPPTGMPLPGPGMPGIGYNPMMGMGNYGSQQYNGGGPQQPYGGGYR